MNPITVAGLSKLVLRIHENCSLPIRVVGRDQKEEEGGGKKQLPKFQKRVKLKKREERKQGGGK